MHEDNAHLSNEPNKNCNFKFRSMEVWINSSMAPSLILEHFVDFFHEFFFALRWFDANGVYLAVAKMCSYLGDHRTDSTSALWPVLTNI